MASGHRDVRSMMVRRWVCWAEGERGPIRSTWIWDNFAEEWGCVEEEFGHGSEFWQCGKLCRNGTNGVHPERGGTKHTRKK